MRQLTLWLCLVTIAHTSISQITASLKGVVINGTDSGALAGTSITLYAPGNRSAMMANKEGRFSITSVGQYDSIKFSIVGYHSRVYGKQQLQGKDFLTVELETSAPVLAEVIVKPLTGLDIVKEAAAKIPSLQPGRDFENKGFYREIIRDKEQYYSIAEAIFTAQYFPDKKDYKLQLDRGRSAEDVSATRLFEDFHPGGGPQSVAKNSFIVERPDFLNPKKMKHFSYRLDKSVEYDGRLLYCIHFDQLPNVKEALEKGTLYIDQEDMAIVKYECANSPLGTPYIKDLTGTDKIIAGILNIDLQRKGWKRSAEFLKVDGAWVLSYAEAEYQLAYQQPRKKISLDLTISIELLMTDLYKEIKKEIQKSEEWKRKNLIANLPTAFDSSFWGDRNVISPTDQVRTIVSELSKGATATNDVSGWQYFNRNLFLTASRGDLITMTPLMRSAWEDKASGGLLYRELEGDFVMDAGIRLLKNVDSLTAPDKGFQQAGLMIRNSTDSSENYIFLSAGTGGNPNPKIFFKKTVNGKSKTASVRKDKLEGWLRIEKKGNNIIAYWKDDAEDHWEKIGESNVDWITGKVQVGLAVFASFSGQGPKMHPDMKAEFSKVRIDQM